MKHFLAFLLLSTVVVGQQAPAPATLVLRNGKIVTVDEKMPEAQAIAIRGDRIAAVGTNASIQQFIGPSTQVIDLRGQGPIVTPEMVAARRAAVQARGRNQ